MEPREAFFLGYLTSFVGIPFRALDILNAANAKADAALSAKIAAQIDALRAKNADTVDSVMRVEALLGKNNLPRPPRPQTLQQWIDWASAASQAAGGAIKPEAASAAALSAGGFFGDLLAATQLAVIVVGLNEDGANQLLHDYAMELGKHAARAIQRLELVLRHPALPANAKPLIEQAVAPFRTAADKLPSFAALKGDLNKILPQLADAF